MLLDYEGGAETLEVQTEETATEVVENEGTAPEEAQPGPEAGSDSGVAGDETFRLDADGNLQVDDSVLTEHRDDLAAMPESKLDAFGNEDEQKPIDTTGLYTTEDLVKAYMDNKIEADKVPPALRDFHQAVLAEQARRQEIQALANPAPAQPQQMIPHPGNPPQPTPFEPLRLDQQQYQQLQEGAKKLAAKYLGVDEKDLDEYNAAHSNAIMQAASDIKSRADQIHKENWEKQQQSQVQQWQRHAQAYQQQQAQVRQAQYQNLVNEFKKNPNWPDIDKNYYPMWFAKQDLGTQQAIQKVMAQGDIKSVQKVMDVVFKAYAAQKKAAHPQPRRSPPAVMSTTNEADYSQSKGQISAANLEDMSPEERANWFIQSKLV